MTHHRLETGDVVVDRDQSNPDEAVVINTPPATADDWHVHGGETVAEQNPGYRTDEPVVCVMYRDVLESEFPMYSGVAPLSLSELSSDSIPFYAYPESRLICRDELGPVDLDIDTIRPFPAHSRNFSVDQNRDFISEISDRGHPKPLPLIRVYRDAEERPMILNGHKRLWAASVAGIERIPCRTVYQCDSDAVRAWAKRHLPGYDADQLATAKERLRDLGHGSLANDLLARVDGGD